MDIEDLFEQYKNKVYRLAAGITRNAKDAEDITQNTFVKAVKNRSKFQGRSKPSTWIYRIAYNEAMAFLRKRYRDAKLMSAAGETPGAIFINWPSMPDRDALDGELKERLDRAIAHIPIKYRMPLLLHYTEGLPIKDAAGIMRIKINSFKTRLRRASLLVAKEIKDYYGDKVSREAQEEAKCGLFTGFIYDYINGRLNAGKKSSFERHIKDCPVCISFLDSYSTAVRITKALECRDIPGPLKAKFDIFFKK